MPPSTIILHGPEVVAALAGEVCVVRPVQPQPPDETTLVSQSCNPGWFAYKEWETRKGDECLTLAALGACPFGPPGTALRVRETWCAHWWLGQPGGIALVDGSDIPQDDGTASVACEDNPLHLYYRATYGKLPPFGHIKWRPSSQMPAWASRLSVRLTGVEVRQVQTIKDSEFLAAGVKHPYYADGTCGSRFGLRQVVFPEWWDARHRRAPYRWQDNPHCWFGKFVRCEDG